MVSARKYKLAMGYWSGAELSHTVCELIDIGSTLLVQLFVSKGITEGNSGSNKAWYS